MGREVLSYPKMCCSSTGCLILGDSLVTPGSIRDGLPEESGLSCLAAMWSPRIWYWPEQQTLPMPLKKKRILRITHQILCQFVPHRRNTEANSWNKNQGLCVLPHFLLSRNCDQSSALGWLSGLLRIRAWFGCSHPRVSSHLTHPSLAKATYGTTLELQVEARQDTSEHLRWHYMTVGIQIYVFALTFAQK